MAVEPDIAGLAARAAGLSAGGRRVLLGITGPPGAGKSTLASALVAELSALGERAALVPMDGFHLDAPELERLGLADRKGAPETFDAEGYVALLRRLRADDGPVTAPAFDRAAERTVPGAIVVPAEVRIVVTEGNYLLLRTGAWADVRPLLDEVWYVELPDDVRVPWLVARHVAYGRSPGAAEEWVLRSDETNAQLVVSTRPLADLVVAIRPADDDRDRK